MKRDKPSGERRRHPGIEARRVPTLHYRHSPPPTTAPGEPWTALVTGVPLPRLTVEFSEQYSVARGGLLIDTMADPP
jgi:hypothetical protein